MFLKYFNTLEIINESSVLFRCFVWILEIQMGVAIRRQEQWEIGRMQISNNYNILAHFDFSSSEAFWVAWTAVILSYFFFSMFHQLWKCLWCWIISVRDAVRHSKAWWSEQFSGEEWPWLISLYLISWRLYWISELFWS